MRLTLDDNKDFGALPEGVVLNAEITKCREQEKPWIDNRTGENAVRLVFEFTILDEPYEGRKVWEDLFTSFFPNEEKCKLYAWTLKILGREDLPEGFTLDTTAFEGTKVPIVLGTRHFKKRDGTPGSAQEATILSETEAASLRAADGGAVPSSSPSEGQPTISSTVESTPSSTYDDDSVEPF